jgi:hypothetical protein
MPDSKQGEEEDTDVEKLVRGLRATAKAEAAMVSPPVEMMSLSAEERAEIVAAILGEPATAATRTTVPTGVTSLAEARRRRTRWVTLGLPLAAAAGLALVIGLPSRHPAQPPLPGYDVTAMGGLKEFRGGEPVAEGTGPVAKPERIARDTELTVRLRPATAVEGSLAVRTFVVDGTAVHELTPSVELAPSGAAEIHVRPGATVAAGAHATLRVLVGRPDDVKSAAPSDAAGTPADATGRRWLTVPVDVAP